MGVFQSFSQSSVRSDTVQYNEFVQMVRDDQVARVTIDDDRVTIHGERKDGSKFKTINPGDKDLVNDLIFHKVAIEQTAPSGPSLFYILQIGRASCRERG